MKLLENREVESSIDKDGVLWVRVALEDGRWGDWHKAGRLSMHFVEDTLACVTLV